MINHSLEGKRIGALESRMAGQLGDLIRKRGAELMSAPALREAPVDCLEMVGELIDGISDGEFQVVVAQTGVGISTLLREAAKLGGSRNCSPDCVRSYAWPEGLSRWPRSGRRGFLPR